MIETLSNMQTTIPSVKMLTVDAEDAGQRLDNYLLARLKGVPRTHVYKLVRKGEVRVNKKRASVDQRLVADDIVRIPPVRMAEKAPAVVVSGRLSGLLDDCVLYEDDALIVMNKPAGMAVHGGSEVSLGMIEAMREWREHAGRWGLVHRLDRDTSGCLIVAKKPSVLKALQADWENFQKTYVALVVGQWSTKDKWVDAPLLKNVLQSGERMVQVSSEGKASLSEFSVISAWTSATYVQVKLHTGRTHQIRVHAQFKKHPLLGDERYADDRAKLVAKQFGVRRLMLHARQLTFTHPVTKAEMTIMADVPKDIQGVITSLNMGEG